jgi:PilZ domain
MNQERNGWIGYTRCEECRGTGKKPDGTSCTICWGTGLVAVFQQPTVVSTPPVQSPKRRRFPRYYTDLPLSLRDQREQEFAGRCVVIAEGGIAAMLPEPVPRGSVVTLQLPIPTCPIALGAIVRNQLGLRHGLEFVSLPDSARGAIRQFCNGLMTQSDDGQRDS